MTDARWQLDTERFFGPDSMQRKVAGALYERVAELPIISPHGHVGYTEGHYGSLYNRGLTPAMLNLTVADFGIVGSLSWRWTEAYLGLSPIADGAEPSARASLTTLLRRKCSRDGGSRRLQRLHRKA